MKLYKIEASNWGAFFGTSEERKVAKKKPWIEGDVVRLAQTPNCDAFLFLSKETHEDEVKLL